MRRLDKAPEPQKNTSDHRAASYARVLTALALFVVVYASFFISILFPSRLGAVIVLRRRSESRDQRCLEMASRVTRRVTF